MARQSQVAKLLIAKGADFNAEDYDMRVPTHYASTKSVVEALVAAGADVNRRWLPWTRTPLLDAGMSNTASPRRRRPRPRTAGISWPPIPATSTPLAKGGLGRARGDGRAAAG